MQDLTVEQAIDEFVESFATSLAKATQQSYTTILNQWYAALQLRHPDVEHVSELEDHHAGALHARNVTTAGEPPAHATRLVWASAIRRFWRFLRTRYRSELNLDAASDVMATPRLTKQPPYPGELFVQRTLEILEQEAREAQRDWPEKVMEVEARLIILRDYALALSLAVSGMRISEILGLKRGDISWWEEYPSAKIELKGRERPVFFTPAAKNAILLYVKKRELATERRVRPTDPLFIGHSPRTRGRPPEEMAPLTRSTAFRRIRFWGDQVEQEMASEEKYINHHLKPHDFRHFAITSFWQATGDLYLAGQLAGHASTTTTERYTHTGKPEMLKRFRQVHEPKQTREANDT